MCDSSEHQTLIDDEHLKLLVLGYRIAGAVNAFFSLLGILYLGLGLLMAKLLPKLPPPAHGQPPGPPPELVGWFLAIIGCVIFILMVALAGLKFWAAQCLKQRRHRTFCQVIAAFTCLGIPYGTALGALTFIVLSRPSVRGQFLPQPLDQE